MEVFRYDTESEDDGPGVPFTNPLVEHKAQRNIETIPEARDNGLSVIVDTETPFVAPEGNRSGIASEKNDVDGTHETPASSSAEICPCCQKGCPRQVHLAESEERILFKLASSLSVCSTCLVKAIQLVHCKDVDKNGEEQKVVPALNQEIVTVEPEPVKYLPESANNLDKSPPEQAVQDNHSTADQGKRDDVAADRISGLQVAESNKHPCLDETSALADRDEAAIFPVMLSGRAAKLYCHMGKMQLREFIVTHVESPSTIFVRPRHQELEYKRFEKFIDTELALLGQRQALPNEKVCPGTSAAVKFRTHRYRCKILAVSNDQIRVRLLDNGRIESVKKENLFVLPKPLLIRNAFCHCVTMNNVIPLGNGDKWSLKAIETFKDVISRQICVYLVRQGEVFVDNSDGLKKFAVDFVIKEIFAPDAFQAFITTYTSVATKMKEQGLLLFKSVVRQQNLEVMLARISGQPAEETSVQPEPSPDETATSDTLKPRDSPRF